MRANSKHHCAFAPTLPRTGMTLLELAVASAIFTFMLTTCVQMLRVVSDQQRASDRRLFAMQTVQNLAEQLSNVPFDELSSEIAGKVAIPTAAEPYLQKARLTIKVFDEAEPAAKRTTIELIWHDHRANAAGPVRLTTWSYPDAASN